MTVPKLHDAFVKSPAHYRNLVDPEANARIASDWRRLSACRSGSRRPAPIRQHGRL